MARLFCILLVLAISLTGHAAEEKEEEDFVTASLLMASPGNILYSCVGHVCIRMQCPSAGLDNIYSYEGENERNQFGKFFAGKLKMGMVRVPSDLYISLYKKDGRGLKEYTLNLPISTKKRLWEILDKKTDEGMNLPYDYAKRGCALTCLHFLMQAATDSLPLEFAPWPEKYERTQREILMDALSDAPWSRLCLNTIIGCDADQDAVPTDKVGLPSDLIEVLQQATIQGKPVISTKPTTLNVEKKGKKQSCWVTPLMISTVFLLLAIIGCFVRCTYLDWPLLALQFALGCFIAYLLTVSTLPCDSWNWLIIPFNPLPLALWRWKKYWIQVYTAALIIWLAVILIYPHMLTDWTYVVLTLSIIIMYIKVIIRYHVNKKID